jgi:hypothetical protein
MIAIDASLVSSRRTAEAFASDFCGALADILTLLRAVRPDFCKVAFSNELTALAWKETNTEKAITTSERKKRFQTLETIGRWLGRQRDSLAPSFSRWRPFVGVVILYAAKSGTSSNN